MVLSENKYLFNNKELQDEQLGGVNLDWYDYGARFYDPALGRFTTQDPLADEFSSWTPYHYVHNNPIIFTDPTGMWANPIYDYEGNHLGNDELGFTGEAIFMTKKDFESAGGEGMDHETALQQGELFSSLSEGSLSLEAYAKVWNNMLSTVPGVDMSILPNESVSVFDGTYYQLNDNYGTIKYGGFNQPSNASGALASVPYNEDKITVNYLNKDYLRTVENVQNALGEHEYIGHILMGYSDKTNTHHKIYEFQMSRPSWKNTTSDYKSLITRNYRRYLNAEQ